MPGAGEGGGVLTQASVLLTKPHLNSRLLLFVLKEHFIQPRLYLNSLLLRNTLTSDGSGGWSGRYVPSQPIYTALDVGQGFGSERWLRSSECLLRS